MQDFDMIYSEYFSEVYKFTLSLCRNPELAEEVTQEAFFKALKNIDSFKGECQISTWLCKIARNTFLSYTKKQDKNASFPLEVLSSGESIEDRFSDKETTLEIYEVLHKLKEPYKEVFWMRTLGELSFAKIGAVFDKTESWARVTYYRAKVLIKEELK